MVAGSVSITKKKDTNQITVQAVGRIYKLLNSEEASCVIPILDKGKTRSKELMKKSGLTEGQYYPLMKQLEKYALVGRDIGRDRSVSYFLTPHGRQVIKDVEKNSRKLKQYYKRNQLLLAGEYG